MKKTKTILALLLCFALVFSFFVFFDFEDSSAEAATSLPGIEEIKQNSDTFNILEIVPEEGSGSIGWYISGQEPGADWAHDILASLPTADRTTAANNYLSALEADGLLGISSTPLFKIGNYVEYKPWDDMTGVTGISVLALSDYETFTNIVGTFTANADTGEYRADNTYSVSTDGSDKNYDQDMNGFSLLTAAYTDGETHYYCTLGTFSPLTAFGDVNDGVLIYRVVEYADADSDGIIDDPYDITILASDYSYVFSDDVALYLPEELIYLSFSGCMGSSYLTGLNLLAEYFTVPFTVSTTYDDHAGTVPQFEATAAGFVRVADGYGHFDATTMSYTYVGLGSAEADFIYSSAGTDSYTVKTDTVFYTGGFTNNNWFLTDVFDWESGELAPAITVNSISATSVTESDVSNADMIVLSNGRGTITSPYTSLTNDISADISTTIQALSSTKLPIIVDNALRSLNSLNIGQLATALATETDAHYVSGNIYCLDTALATSSFNAEISGDHTNTGDPFYEVWYEIDYENFLRTQNDPSAVTLPETVSIATCVRYIINYGGQRVISKKASIRVLELQPGEGHHLTTSKVSGWTGLPTTAITIDTLSTAEFIGKIDDLVEKYDLVYVGSDVTGFSTDYHGSTQYTDSDMNGLIYSNIGDLYLSGYNLTGLLDRDYGDYYSYGYRVINYSNTSRTYRLSGNDITPSKVSELLDYASAGYPIVVADNLMSGTPATDAFSFTAVIADNEGTLNATAVAAEGSSIPYGITKTYQWYVEGEGEDTLVSSSGSSFMPEEAGTYYCIITISGYTAKSNTAVVTLTEEDYTATPEYPSTADPDSFPNGNTTYTISISRSGGYGSYTYSIDVSPMPLDPSDVDYRWQYYKHPKWRDIGTNSSTYTAYDTYPYRCIVTLFDQYYCESPSLDYNDFYPRESKYDVPDYTEFNSVITVTDGPEYATLTASSDPDVSSYGSVSYYWYRYNPYYYDTLVDSSASIWATEGTYYCLMALTIGSGWYSNTYYAESNRYTVSGGDIITAIMVNEDSGPAATVPETPASYDVSTETVDYCSNAYTFLDTVSSYANTFTESGAALNSSSLIQYLNLSKPEIDFSKDAYGTYLYPTKYTGTDGSSLSGNTLSYTFTINNATDVTPTETRYYCNLYIDMNADGRYDYSELLADIRISDSYGNVVRSGELRAGLEYTVTRQMPDEYVGIIPWQLEVVKATQSRVHASQHGYTHINGTPKTIYILQILHNSGGLNLTTHSTYQSLFSQVDDFNLNISTIRAGDLSGVTSGSVVRLNEEGISETVTYSSLDEYLDTFDMLILGFADCYGELDATAAAAVVEFINNPAGKAVLFTHDTTSFVNLPFSPYPATDGHTVSTSTWGYYFNTIIRDAVGLDRYGVTNPDYGVTTYSPNKSDLTDECPEINVADNNSSNSIHGETELSASDINTLVGAGYSIAYEPIFRESVGASTTKTMVSEIQGFTNYNLFRYRDNYDHGTTATSRVSQVNEGQITTYPFDLNLYGFGDNTDAFNTTMTIASTHEQYYQLNMNPADIVVWYCLAGAGYNDSYGDPLNDVVNSYYIYSIGNVTYSGAGHSGSSVSVDEAKLFINTMIAAYRTATTPPELTIIDPETGDVLTDKFYVGDETSLLATSSYSLADAAIYFTITDPSLGAGKVITATFDYDGTSANLPIYVKDGSASPINGTDGTGTDYSLSGGVTYYVKLSSELMAYIQANGSAVLTVTITSNLLPSQPATAQITLHELGLFPLD